MEMSTAINNQITARRRADEAMQLVVSGKQPFYKIEHAAPECPIDNAKFEAFMAVDMPIVRRLLFWVHYNLCFTKTTYFYATEYQLAAFLWTGRRPDNWKRGLRASLARLATVPDAPQVFIETECIKFLVPPAFLGTFICLLGPGDDGVHQLFLRLRMPNPDTWVTKRQLRFLYDNGHPKMVVRREGGYTDETLRAKVREVRTAYARLPSLGRIAKTHPYRTFFVPAVLGRENICRELGDVVNLLVNNHTRTKPVTDRQLPSGGKSKNKFYCKLLDPDEKYVAFCGNSGGRSYRADTWASRLNTDAVTFLHRLEAARDRLGFTVFGVDRFDHTCTLDELIDSPRLREDYNVRIFSAPDFRSRWATLFGWPCAAMATEPTDSAEKPTNTDHDLLVTKVKDVGVRAMADRVEIKASNLSRFLATGSGLSTLKVGRLRKLAFGNPVLTLEYAREVLANCRSRKEWAVGYARLGLSIIPLWPGTRIPHLSTWKPYQTAVPTQEQVARWWDTWPDAGIAAILGPISGLLAIDTDDEIVVPTAMELMGDQSTKCPAVISGSHAPGHGHYLFRHPDMRTKAKNTDAHESKKLEVRGSNGLLVLPPSLHRSGLTYDWIDGRSLTDLEVPEAPPNIIALLAAANSEQKGNYQGTGVPATVPEGTDGFSHDFSKYNGRRLPAITAAVLRGEYAHRPEWNINIYNAACWCRQHGVLKNKAITMLLAAAKPDTDNDRDAALATINSAYSCTH
jgi:hypothetical protein